MTNVARYIVEVPLTYDTQSDPLTERDAFEMRVFIYSSIRESYVKFKHTRPEFFEALNIDITKMITVTDDNK